VNRSSTRSQIIASAASLALAAALLVPGVIHADALPLYIGDPTANEKPASGIFCSLGEGNVKGSLSLAAEKRWGNDYMHARYYSPNLGRFMSVDPVGGSIGSSQSWNRYSYVENNPLAFLDPNGRLRIRADFHGSGANNPGTYVYDIVFQSTSQLAKDCAGDILETLVLPSGKLKSVFKVTRTGSSIASDLLFGGAWVETSPERSSYFRGEGGALGPWMGALGFEGRIESEFNTLAGDPDHGIKYGPSEIGLLGVAINKVIDQMLSSEEINTWEADQLRAIYDVENLLNTANENARDFSPYDDPDDKEYDRFEAEHGDVNLW
jgi:RHS repeat-associated protein